MPLPFRFYPTMLICVVACAAGITMLAVEGPNIPTRLSAEDLKRYVTPEQQQAALNQLQTSSPAFTNTIIGGALVLGGVALSFLVMVIELRAMDRRQVVPLQPQPQDQTPSTV